MIMESPVRICLGVTLIVHLLLLIITSGSGNALPLETTSATVRDEKRSRFARTNSTWTIKTIPKTSDAALNELRKDSASEEHLDKNAKYKDRGRVRFNPLAKSTTVSTLKRVTISSPTEASSIIVVTSKPEIKKPALIIDSMKTYKKTKISTVASSTTSSVLTEPKYDSDEDFDSDEEEDMSTFGKYSSIDDFFTIPTFDSDSFMKKNKKGPVKKPKEGHSTASFDDFSSFFPDDTYNSKDKPYKSESFFDFERELTTPKNDFFDKKFSEFTSSIINNFDQIKSQPPNTTSKKHQKENIGLETFRNGTPNNKSMVIIKNTKEFRVFDNDEAGTSNKELSDVHGTSIYYEMSVLSTETYNISHSEEDDCENDTLPSEAAATQFNEELPYLVATLPTFQETSTKPTISDPLSQAYSTVSSKIFSDSIIPSVFNSISPAYSMQNAFKPSDNMETKIVLSSSIPYSTQNAITFTDTEKYHYLRSSSIPQSTQNTTSLTENEKIKNISSTFMRSRYYSKRLNLTGNKDSPNSVTVQADQVSINPFRPLTRRFHYTTPKIKPIWMAPRKNITRATYIRSTYPTTIYFEHFNIKDKFSSTLKPRIPTRTVLTTSASDIDPVLQSDVSGSKKIVHSPSISDNTIPTLWKRGSTKFSTSTATSAEAEPSISEMEIPPTLTAWALASLRSPPSLASPVINSIGSTQKSIDENESQNVGEVVDKNNSITTSTTTTSGFLNNEILLKNGSNIEMTWKPLFKSSSSNSNELINDEKSTEFKSETQPAESNISLQNSPRLPTTVSVKKTTSTKTTESYGVQEAKPTWESIEKLKLDETTTEESRESSIVETIPPVDAINSTGFESITKLPSGLTTPMDETAETFEGTNEKTSDISTTKISYNIPTTTDYEITTIRFSYVPTEKITERTETEPSTILHSAISTKNKPTTIEDRPITTYRPVYIHTTDSVEESTTLMIDTTQKIQVSSQTIDNLAQTITEQNIHENRPIYTGDATTQILSTEPTTTDVNDESTVILETTTINGITTDKTEMKVHEETGTSEEEKTTTSTEISTQTEIQEAGVPQTEKHETIAPQTTTYETEAPQTEMHEINSPQTNTFETEEPQAETHETENPEESSGSNEIIQPITRISMTTPLPITELATPPETFTTTESTTKLTTIATEPAREPTTETTAKIVEITTEKEIIETTTDETSMSEDYTEYSEMTTESSSRVLTDEAGSGATVAIAVSTIGVIALVLLVGLLLVVRRRGRRGVYAQRCTPVSLDAYSLDSVSVGQRKGNQRLRASKRSYGNPAYDDEVTSHPMNYAALANFALDIDSMSAEFAEIPSVTVRPDEVPPGCEDKNRYSNVLPLPETRVPLRRIGNDPTSEYINANYVTGPGNIRNYYIMCQAPLANTVVDFWRMVWEQNSRLVVMLTEYMENGVEKCYEYLPPSEISDNRRTFAEFQIILKKREQRDKYAISSVQFINLATRSWREVTHLWYFWPAKGVPDDYDSVIDFLSEMRSYMKISQNAKEYDEEGVEVIYGDQSRSSYNNLSKLRSDNGSGNGLNVYSPAKAEEMMRRGRATNGTLGRMKAASEFEAVRPCVVVCASGAGRSAALVAADICARALAAGAADVPRTVRDLRAQRPHSLSNRHHYIFVYKVLSEYGNKLMGGGVDTI